MKTRLRIGGRELEALGCVHLVESRKSFGELLSIAPIRGAGALSQNDNLMGIPAKPAETMPQWSSYAGQSIDLTSRRSVEIDAPSGSDVLIEADAKVAVVDYFFHASRFWRAVIPLDGVERLTGQAFNFSTVRTHKRHGQREIVVDRFGIPKHRIPILNHVQARFTLAPDKEVKLYALGSEVGGEPQHVIHDFVYSLEVLGPSSVKFNLKDGLTGNLLSAHRFLSTQEMVFERLVVANEYVIESPPLPLTARERRQFLIESLLRSHHAGLSEVYYLYRPFRTNNCTSSPLMILDKVVKYRWFNRLGAMLYRLPLSPRFYLRIRGLDSDPAQRKLVRQEFVDYIEDPVTQARKKKYLTHVRATRRAAQHS
jgi:hypothetical protein